MTVRLVSSVEIVRIAKTAGFDAIYVDLEHSAFSLETTGQLSAPREVLNRLNSEVARVMGNAEFRKKYLGRGIEMVASRSPEEFSAYVKSEADAFARLVRDAGIKVE